MFVDVEFVWKNLNVGDEFVGVFGDLDVFWFELVIVVDVFVEEFVVLVVVLEWLVVEEFEKGWFFVGVKVVDDCYLVFSV